MIYRLFTTRETKQGLQKGAGTYPFQAFQRTRDRAGAFQTPGKWMRSGGAGAVISAPASGLFFFIPVCGVQRSIVPSKSSFLKVESARSRAFMSVSRSQLIDPPSERTTYQSRLKCVKSMLSFIVGETEKWSAYPIDCPAHQVKGKSRHIFLCTGFFFSGQFKTMAFTDSISSTTSERLIRAKGRPFTVAIQSLPS